jgi:hypothetical protein
VIEMQLEVFFVRAWRHLSKSTKHSRFRPKAAAQPVKQMLQRGSSNLTFEQLAALRTEL